MLPLESILFWITMVLYAFAAGGYVYAFVFRNSRIFPKLVWLVAGAFILHALTIGARTAAQGHLPWAGDYENALMAGWFIIAITLFIAFRHAKLQALAVGTVPASLLIMGFGVMRHPVLSPMAASLKSFWLYIHVYFAWLAYGAYTLAMAAGVVYLLKQRNTEKGIADSVYDRLPRPERLEELIFQYVVFGFIIDAVMIAAGSIWAKNLWGNYWSWDPVETWSLVSWLVYGITIHLRVTMGWRGRKLAWLAIAALSTVIISFFGVTIVVDTSQHFFNVR